MSDISLRAIETLRKVDVIACEDTRETGKLCAAHGISARKIAYHDHNAAAMRPRIIEMIQAGQSVALVSDAGVPLISDPGCKLVQACIEAAVAITCIPGASASLTALVLSGLPTDRFFFAGFLPPKSGARRRELQNLRSIPGTLIFYETAPRLIDSLTDMNAILGSRSAAVARELTKMFEEVRRGTLEDLANHYTKAGPPRGEIVVVIAPALETDPDDALDLDALLRTALAQKSLKEAVAIVTAQTGMKKKEVYARALALRAKQDHPDL